MYPNFCGVLIYIFLQACDSYASMSCNLSILVQMVERYSELSHPENMQNVVKGFGLI